jgi:hypothetical protein
MSDDLQLAVTSAKQALLSGPLDVVIGKLRQAASLVEAPRAEKVTALADRLEPALATLNTVEDEFLALFGLEK